VILLFGLGKEGKVSTKQAYEVKFLEENDDDLEDWLIDIWKWQIDPDYFRHEMRAEI
jgi:hypothetical protein